VSRTRFHELKVTEGLKFNPSVTFYHRLVIKRDKVDMCLKRPGYDVDVYITTRLKTLSAVWIGDIRLCEAVKQDLIELQGPGHLTRQVE
jgi:hypothetical protein